MNEETYQQIRSLFSDGGMESDLFVVKAKGDVRINVSCEEDHVDIDFTESKDLPEITVKIVEAKVDGITLGKRGGKIKLKSLPDIPFLYKWIEK